MTNPFNLWTISATHAARPAPLTFYPSHPMIRLECLLESRKTASSCCRALSTF